MDIGPVICHLLLEESILGQLCLELLHYLPDGDRVVIEIVAWSEGVHHVTDCERVDRHLND